MNKQQHYQHGGSPQHDLARLNLSDRPVLDFSVNLNPFGVPRIIRERWAEFLEAIENYPSVEGQGITRYYLKKFGISSANVLAGNGSTELIYLVPRVLRFKRVLIITPSFHDYERASLLAGAEIERFPLMPDSNTSTNELIEALEYADALWLGRPNNPTGSLLSKKIILDLAGRFPDKWFIIDEAFIQFVDTWEEESFIIDKPQPNIIIIHSLTKFYALAGLRMGGVVGDDAVISRLKASKEPWSVNGIADRIAPLLLECHDYEQESRSMVSTECERIVKSLGAVEGIRPFPSSTNFILCQWGRTNNLDDLIHHLFLNGIYFRDCRNFPGLEDNYFRVGLRTAGENDQLVSSISAFPAHPI